MPKNISGYIRILLTVFAVALSLGTGAAANSAQQQAQEAYRMPQRGGSQKLTISENTPWMIQCNARWLTIESVSPESADTNAVTIADNRLQASSNGNGCPCEFIIEAAPNTTEKQRIGYVMVMLGGSNIIRVPFVQNARKTGSQLSFAELRSELPEAGKIELDDNYIIGHIISEPHNENLETNPHLSWVQVDYNVNLTTAYIQSEDGQYGFRIKSDYGSAVAKLPRYAKVKISLKGMTLTRKDNPVRYTLSGYMADNLLEVIPGNASALAPKNKYIADLVDEDIYTFVSLQDVEIAFDKGSYGNMHDGYALKSETVTKGSASATRCDCVPRTLRDIEGRKMYMLVNAQTPWRRTGRNVPQGSGIVSGIVVHSKLKRYGGDIGAYQLRPLSESDIQLHPFFGFSTKLVEWDFRNEPMEPGKRRSNKVPASAGKGVMDTSSPLSMKTYDSDGDMQLVDKVMANATAFTGYSYNAFSGYWAGRYCGTWWNFERNEGEWVSWNFSTKGITGSDRHLTLIFTAALGNQSFSTMCAPLYWNLEYSVDGQNFHKYVENIIIYPAPIFAYKGMDIPAGLAEYVFELPDDLLDKDDVTVRIKAASTVSSSSKGLGTANVDESTLGVYFRFEGVSVKYNN